MDSKNEPRPAGAGLRGGQRAEIDVLCVRIGTGVAA
jgi:hypothetical protein